MKKFFKKCVEFFEMDEQALMMLALANMFNKNI